MARKSKHKEKRRKRHVEKIKYRVQGFALIAGRRCFITEYIAAYSPRQAVHLVTDRFKRKGAENPILYACKATVIDVFPPDPKLDAIQRELKFK